MGFAESSNGGIRLLHMYGVERSGTMVSSRTPYFLLSPVIGVLIYSFQSGNGWRAAQGAIPVNVYALTRSKKVYHTKRCPRFGVSHPPPTAASRVSTSSILIPRLQSPESFTDAGDPSDVSRSQPTAKSLAVAVSGRTYRRIRPRAAPSQGENVVRVQPEKPPRPHSKPRGSRLSSNEQKGAKPTKFFHFVKNQICLSSRPILVTRSCRTPMSWPPPPSTPLP
ncbi:hypothetical protein BDP67DRAFT_272963 [Colletotrichum lupini]|nr:hypothetical protein BDP67DRAFT_272963 [Colletotrichum lupini]